MKRHEIISLITLYSTFMIFLLLLGLPYFYIGIFEALITWLFYFLGLAVPLYFFVRFILKRTIKAFKLIIVASVPMLVFTVIFIITIIELAQALEHF